MNISITPGEAADRKSSAAPGALAAAACRFAMSAATSEVPA